MFKVGDKVRRVHRGHMAGIMEVGTEATVSGIVENGRRVELNGDTEYAHDPECLELVQPTGPVVTETVTKTRIVPGTYDGVQVGFGMAPRTAYVYIYEQRLTPDELDAAAAVLSTLAKGLRDA